MIIGITGASGSGKTSLSKFLKEIYKGTLIDADEIVKNMSTPGNIYFVEIVKHFGKEILLSNGQINKSKLAQEIFTDKEKKNKLDSLTFKYVVEEIKQQVKLSKNKTIVIDAPLLIESKLNKICDITISIIADTEVKIKRICKRDNIDKQKALERLKAQQKDEFYINNSNYIIINNDNNKFEETINSIKEIIDSKIVNEEIVIIQDEKTKILQFKELLKYKNKITHAFTLKPLDLASNATYHQKEEQVKNNYEKIFKLLNQNSKNIIRPYQTHTNNVKEVKEECGIFNEKFIDVDALITKEKEKILSLVFADCTPIYLYDKQKNAIGIIHSGWQGTVKTIAKKTVQFMKEKYKSNPKDIICVIGPTIRQCHFEVKKDVRDIFYNTFSYMKDIDKIISYKKETNTYFIDTVQINKNQLLEEGLAETNIIDSKICSFCNSNIIYSYRKEGEKAGRNTAIIGLSM